MRKPSWMVRREAELKEAGLSASQLEAAQVKYREAGIDLNRVQRRGWRLYGIGRGNGPTYVVLWASLETLVTDCDKLIVEFQNKREGR